MAQDDARERFEVRSDPESIEPDAQHDGTNLARFVLAGAARRGVLADAVEFGDLASFGFSDRARERATNRTVPGLIDEELRLRSERRSGVRSGGAVSSAFDESAYGAALEYEEARDLIERYRHDWNPLAARRAEWAALSEGADAYFAFLVAGLCSPRERESIAAAVALLNATRQRARFLAYPTDTEAGDDTSASDDVPDLDWGRASWEGFSSFRIAVALRRGVPRLVLAAVYELARLRVELAVTSADGLTRGLAAAAFFESSDDLPETYPLREGWQGSSTSTMVHGTRGYRGDWWEPQRGGFHGWMRQRHRPDLYAGSRPYSWSGAFSRNQRADAARRLKIWAAPAGGLRSVFAHSYGAEVVGRAVDSGLHVDELVMLSAPITQHHHGLLTRVRRVIDVRLRVDPVLWLATIADRRVRHSISGANVTSFVLPRGYLHHSATHDREVWKHLGIAAQVGL